MPTLNVVDHHMPLGAAVQAARIHHQWQPDLLYTEINSLSAGVAADLTRMGYHLESQQSIGDVQAVALDAGVLTGASDTRSEGAPAGF